MSDKTDKAASKTATKKPAKKATAKKPAAKKAAAKKPKAGDDSGLNDDAAAAKKPAAKKPAAKKPAAKKPAAKKPAAKKPAAKKPAAKKPAAKKAAAKKPAAKKPAAKKPAAKKGAAKKGKAKVSVDCTGKSLVIVESPAKAKTINKYLGDAFVVKASMGHIRDLPPRDLGVSIDKKFAPTYDVLADKKKIVTELRKLAKDAEQIFYACDPDREGEAIAWHLSEILKSNKPSARVTFNEITKAAIERAFESPGQIDMNKVSAQQARRILDRIVGYKISPLLWNKVKPNLSAGRVQSVAVKLIAQREAQIRAFEAKEYWRLTAEFRQGVDAAAESAKFFADLNNLGGATLDPKGFCIENQARAKAVQLRLAKGEAKISRCDVKERKDDPFPPFITSTLQQAASTKLRFSTKKTMFLAQELYEGVDLGGDVGLVGLITYMRTDSFNLAQEALDAGRGYIKEHFGEKYLPEKPRVYKTKKKSAQEAHEAIRPTNPELSPAKVKAHLTADQHKLYQLIWNRFIGCQMTSAQYAHKTVEVTLTPSPTEASAASVALENTDNGAAPATDARYDGPGTFRIVGKSVVFDGHARVTGLKLKPQEPILPEFKVGDPIDLLKLQESQHFTQPPPRYTEASLVKTLEEYGIGRPSTYSAITQTIQDRGYVRQEARRLYATRLGEIVTTKLDEHFSDILNTDFTSQMEQKLDQVEDAQQDWVKVLDNFYQPFEKDLAEANEKMKGINEDPKKSDLKCEKCDNDMFYMYNRRDLSRFLGCGDYPKCKTTLPVDEEDKPQIPEETKENCTKCGSSMVIRQGKNGRFIACSAYPQCDNTKEIDAEGKATAAPELAAPVNCEDCGKEMKLKRSRYGHFLGCSGYPKCRVTLRVTVKDGVAVPEEKKDDEETPKIDVKCEKCGAPMSLRRSRRGPFLGCSRYPKCRSIADVPEGLKLPSPPKPKEIGEDCPDCGAALIERRGRRGPFIACSGYPKCKFTRPVKGEKST